MLFQGPARSFTISGIIGFGDADNLGGARLVGFDLATAQEVMNREGRFDEIDAAAQEGVTPEQLRDRIRAAVDPKYEVLTGEELAADQAAAINDTIGRFLGTALLAFAFVALLVGAFLIFNTFTIIVAQRTRELALLRCLGASRRQVMTSVLVESFIVALVASLVGLGLGVLIAIGLRALLSAFLGADIPATGIQFLPRTVIVSLVVGLVVTVLAALLPALKATRVPPVAALQPETAFAPTGFRKRRIVLGVLVTAVGVALLLAGLFRSEGNRLVNVASGAVVVFFGVAILSPLIARPLARVIGWPFARAFRLPGTLARQNAMRNPRRTASTAAALMIGLALVSFVSIFAASIKASTTKTLEDTVSADYILMNDNFQPFSPEAAQRLAEQPQLAAVAGVRIGPWKLNGAGKTVQAVDPAAYQQVVRTEVTAGNLGDLASGGLAVKDTVAKANGWTVGEQRAHGVPPHRRRAGPGEGDLQGQQPQRRLPARPDHLRARLRRPGGPRDPGQGRPRGRPGRVAGRGRPGDGRLPQRHRARPGRVQGRAGQADRPDHQPVLLAARPGHPDRPVRHREHARPVDLRAHPGARPAPGGRGRPAASCAR